jgi:FkbM family methyltransferase
MTMFRDFFRRRRLARHVAQNGWAFSFRGLPVRLPQGVDIGIASGLLRNKYEREEADLIEQFLPPGTPVIELGGSLGIVSRLIRSKLTPGTPHLILEANPALIETCAANSKAAPDDPVILVNAALFHGGPEVRFETGGSVHANKVATGADTRKTIVVPAVTLEQLWQQLGSPVPYSLVCDIEGAEEELILQEAGMIGKAQMLIMELHPQLYGKGQAGAETLKGIMHSLGFTVRAEINNVVAWSKSPP